MNNVVVLDASLAIMWAIPEQYTTSALILAEQWLHNKTHLLAPCLLLTEITNAIYKRVLRNEINMVSAHKALNIILEFNIELLEESGLSHRSMELAHSLKMPATYDAHYLALAEKYNCNLWTGDKKLYNSAKSSLNWIKWIGNFNL